ncbi:ABC transporter permease [Parablautia intestinalis]|uniref:ABC transporter permease n=1 Tax=Parablautia intestinalis TaxID=2320100 RepID=UPI002412667B|nr:ABC transporter permease [Parablautia intestinalis]
MLIVVGGLYPIKNRDVLLVVDIDGETESIMVTAEEMQLLHQIKLPYSGSETTGIKEIRFYRHFTSLCISKISMEKFDEYAYIDGNELVFNENTLKKMKELSTSVISERLLYVEVILAGIILVWILLNALDEKINPKNYDNHGPIYEIKRFANDLVKYQEYIIFSARADLKAEVANSYLNRLWWLLEPFFNMLVYVVVFGKVMGRSVENYATFVFSALLMWNYFSKTVNYSVKCVRNSRDIVTKIYVPKYVLLLSNMVLNFIKLLFSLLVLVVMLIVFQVSVGNAVFWVIPAYIVMIVLSFGVGMIFLHYGVYVDDLAYAVGILLQMLMFLSGIFYEMITALDAPLNEILLCFNPVAVFIDTMRNALLNNRVTNVPLIGVWLILAILLSYIGIHNVYRNENGYVKVI